MPVDASQIVLRGCSLRNTDFVYAMVIYTGKDTKIMLNSVKARVKTSKVLNLMNNYMIYIIILQIFFCLFAAVANVIINNMYWRNWFYIKDE